MLQPGARIEVAGSFLNGSALPSGDFSTWEESMTSRALLLYHLSIVFSLSPVLLGALAPPAQARTWQILVDGSGDAPSVQAGIDSANVGDVVLVGPGTYYENLDFFGKDITVKSVMGPKVTILDGSSRDSSVVVFKRGETSNAVLEGFTITGGTGSRMPRRETSREGAGVYCYEGSPTIRNNWVIGNRTLNNHELGGGMLVGTAFTDSRWSEPLVEGNVFTENEAAGNGGAIGCMAPSRAVIRGNVFRNNRCGADGGAIWGWTLYGSVTIEDNEFWENVAGDHGGGVYASDPGAADPYLIRGNLFVRNRTTGDGFSFISGGSGGGVAAIAVGGTIERNTFFGNDGQHVAVDGGGGLLLSGTAADLRVAQNIIADSKQGGIACWRGATATMEVNLLWSNEGGDLGSGSGECPSEWLTVVLIDDPLFCCPAMDDYTVAVNSPALTGEEVIGKYGDPGCGVASVERITWGQLKSRYR